MGCLVPEKVTQEVAKESIVGLETSKGQKFGGSASGFRDSADGVYGLE